MGVMVALSTVLLLAIAKQGYALEESDSNEASNHMWKSYKNLYNLRFPPNMEEIRKGIFLKNLKFIEQHNREHTNMTLEMNKFGHMTDEEFAQSYLSPLDEEFSPVLDKNPDTVTFDTVDWRTKGVVGSIRNQGHCGSCWAFSAIASMESAHALHTGTYQQFSEQDLVDCSLIFGNFGCHGGFMDNAFRYVIANGITSGQSYTYTAKDGRCQHSKFPVVGKVSSFVDIQSGSENSLTEAIKTKGPVSVAIYASLSSFRFYKSGIYYDSQCSSFRLNHGVAAVGVADDYYIVRNSWGESWGDNGYIKMARNRQNNCGIASKSSYPVV